MIVEGQVHGGLADGVGHGADGADRLRRGRQLPRRLVHGLPDPDLAGGARTGSSGETVTPVAAPPDRRQGRRRVGNVGSPPAIVNAVVDALQALRRPPHRHAVHARAGVGGDAGEGGAAAMMRGALAGGARRARRRGRPFVDGDGRARAAPDQRPAGRRARSCSRDGTIDGFVGGACAESSVRLHALRGARDRRAAAAADPSPSAEADGAGRGRRGRRRRAQPVPDRRRARDLPRAPAAGAARSWSPATRRSPRALAELGRAARATTSSRHRRARPQPGDAAVVVASHGRDEERGAAPRRSSAGVPLRRRSSPAGRAARRPRGLARRLPEELRERVHTPAGLAHRRAHAGGDRAVDPRRDRRGAARRSPDAAAGSAASTAIDPVCGMAVVGSDTPRRRRTTAFCCEGCWTA